MRHGSAARRLQDAFLKAFCVAKNKESWEKVGTAPFTKACLNNPKVRHVINEDPLFGSCCSMEILIAICESLLSYCRS